MDYNYSKLKNTWTSRKNVVEGFEDTVVSMSLPEWKQYVAEGKNVMYPAIKSGRVDCPYCGKFRCNCSGKGPNPFGGCGCGGRTIF
jgi:hypothetical protein